MMFTVQQAAERAAVSESLVYAWVADGTLPHTRLGRKGKRGTIRIDPADLDGVLAAFKVGASSAPPPPVKRVKLRHLRQPS